MSDTSNIQLVPPNPVIDLSEGQTALPETIQPGQSQVQDGLGEPGPQGDEPSIDDSQEQPEIETVTITRDGAEYQIPKALEDAFLFHGDYTRKTQELADQRRVHEADVTTFQARVKVQQEHLGDVAQLQALDSEIARLTPIAGGQVPSQSPEDYQQAVNALTVYQVQRQQVGQRIDERVAQVQREMQEQASTRRTEAMTFAAREIPNWTPDQERTLTAFAVQQGVPERFIEQAISAAPASLKVLHLAKIGQQFLDSQRTAKAKPKPVKTSKVGQGSGPVASGPRDDMSVEDWVAARNQQLAAKRKAQGR